MNKLAGETSPYLRAHADNPVDWHPWGNAATALARSQARPILLSIGYSACHWCHVMARESFQDAATAVLMNEQFVNVKVDREERPDVDSVYQLGHRLLTRQSGGWPLTAFLDPETLLPFFSGTYFPRRPRYGLPGFADLLRHLADAFTNQPEALAKQGERLASAIAAVQAPPEDESGEAPALAALVATAREQLGSQYDSVAGGFGSAPKFPMPAALERLLRHWAGAESRRDRDALNMVTATLTQVARGGIHDHLGGGFFRYATDRQWRIPHFEKMLYDNAALLALYADALALGADPLFAGAVRETAGWLMREMQQPAGGYSAAQDADSDGEEGKFYLWRRDAVKRLLDEEEHLLVETLYGLDKPANFEGKWHLSRRDAWRAVVERLYLEPDAAERRLASARAKLLAARQTRPRPAKDDKVLAAWNGLAIGGMAKAGVRLNEPRWIDSASQAADFLREHLIADGRLHASWKDGVLGHVGFLDDHANVLLGLLSLLAARWRDSDWMLALFLGDELLNRFRDEGGEAGENGQRGDPAGRQTRRAPGGFFFTPHDAETLIHRPKPTQDDALPPGNATVIRALAALAHLAGEQRYLEAAEQAARWALPFAARHPASHCALLTAVETVSEAPELIIVRGPAAEAEAWMQAARSGYRPARSAYLIPYQAHRIPAYLPRLVAADAQRRVLAFRCSGFSCGRPITDLDAFRAAVS